MPPPVDLCVRFRPPRPRPRPGPRGRRGRACGHWSSSPTLLRTIPSGADPWPALRWTATGRTGAGSGHPHPRHSG